MDQFNTSNAERLNSSLQNFREQFPDEEACLSVFPRVCKHCTCTDVELCEGNRSFNCLRCRKKTWITAGTFFHRLENLIPTFAAIWLYEDRIVFSKKQFAESLGISYATAWETIARVQLVIHDEMDTQPSFEVVSTRFDTIICKRSGQTPKAEHPCFEQNDVIVETEPDIDCEKQKRVYQFLSAVPISFDVLRKETKLAQKELSASLGMLEILDLVVSLPGNKFIRQERPKHALTKNAPAWAGSLIHSFTKYVRHFHGISRKYLQLYVASFWCMRSTIAWYDGSLMKKCMVWPPIGRQQILDFISPHMVRMVAS